MGTLLFRWTNRFGRMPLVWCHRSGRNQVRMRHRDRFWL